MTRVNDFICNIIYFPTDIIPISVAHSGTTFFGSSKQETLQYLQGALWGGSINAGTKEFLSKELINVMVFHTPYSRLYDLFALSLMNRALSLFSSSAKLYVDKRNWKPQSKFIASTALTVLPYVFLVYGVGYPPSNLLFNTAVINAISLATSYYSLSMGNYLRCLDLISYDKVFSFSSYAKRLLVSSAFDIALTLLWSGKGLYKDPFMQRDEFHTAKFCVGIHDGWNHATIITRLSLPLISFADKLVWAFGKITFDGLVLAANKLESRWVADIRSPFINALQPSVKRSSSVAKTKQMPINKPKNETDLNQDFFAESSNSSSNEKTKVETTKKDKVKSRPNTAESATANTSAANNSQVITQNSDNRHLQINGLKYYDLPSSNPGVYIGVLDEPKLRKAPSLKPFETCLRTGTVGSAKITLLRNDVSELRPGGDPRVIGTVHGGIDGPNSMYPLAEALEVYDQLGELYGDKTPKIIAYDTYVAKHNELRGAINSR